MMQNRSFFSLVLFFVSMVLLQGCNGTSGENGDNPFGNGTDVTPTPVLNITVLDQACTNQVNATNLGDPLCIQARLAENGVAQANEIIQFSTTLGTFDQSSKLTNAQGIAEVALLSSEATLGAGQITGSFSSGTTTVEASTNFEILAATDGQSTSAQLALSLADSNGVAANRVSADNTLAVFVTLTNAAGETIADQIVNFQTSIGTMNPSSALTNSQGVASTVLTPDDRLGAGTVSATTTVSETLVTNSQNFEVLEADAIADDIVRIGAFENGSFVEGVLGIDGFSLSDDVQLSAGGTVGINVALVDGSDQPIAGNIPVSFASVCTNASDAVVDETALSVNGVARSTYEDISCAGANGNDDVITASISLNGQQLSVTRTIALSAEVVGAIQFIDAQPNNIVLTGTGGQNTNSVSTVTFQVNGALGNPLAQQVVDFSLNTEIGGLSLSPEQALTNSQGQVSTRVTAGTVPTSVRVTATSVADGNSIKSQSDLLSVNTGLPDQDSFSLAPDDNNPEAFNISGQVVSITARLADSFNNPVPDGTSVSFISEGGSIEPSCTTVNGACSVNWTSGNPRPDDHRITILATAIGHESLYDANGNNQYDFSDGPGVNGESGNGLDRYIPTQTGFSDLPEAWLDSNENGIRDGAEPFLDFDASGSFDASNGLFDGPQCSENCSVASLHVRRATIMVLSSSEALLTFVSGTTELANNSSPAQTEPVATINRDGSLVLTLRYSDTAGQTVASGSTVTITASEGTILGDTSVTVPSTINVESNSSTVILTNDLVAAGQTNSIIVATVTSPSGVESTLSIIVSLL